MQDYQTRRTLMVDNQIRPADVTGLPIVEAMLNVPREEYVPEHLREMAYLGENLDIAPGRALIDPRTFAKMLTAADLRDNDFVLDIGCAYGYSAAVEARLAQAVVAVEEDEAMAAEAEAALAAAGADSVAVTRAALAEGAPQHGPYDAILVHGGIEVFPDALAGQLKDGGRAVCLFMEGPVGTCRIGYNSAGVITWRDVFNASAPVLKGFARTVEFSL